MSKKRNNTKTLPEDSGGMFCRVDGWGLLHRFSGFVAGIVVTMAVALLCGSGFTDSAPVTKADSKSDTGCSVDSLLAMSPQELEKIDIGLMSLICAQGLKGAENLNIDTCLAILGKWADQAKADTALRIQAYYRNPAKYDYSINLFKAVNMVLTLKNTIGVDYNLRIMQTTDFIDSRDFFVHGCLTGSKKGGCISIPILCVAVGRRLGYPLKLVLTREHVFVRWDDGKKEKFNIEACCPGVDTKPDEYYMNWPKKITKDDVESYGLLKSLTSAQELAICLETRGNCLYDNGRISEALVMYSHAYRLSPDSLHYLANINMVVQNEAKKYNHASKGKPVKK